MSVKDDLIKAREILIQRGVERDGWFVSKNENPDECKVCAMGAVYLATGGEIVVEHVSDFRYDEETGEDIPTEELVVDIEGQDLDRERLAGEALRNALRQVAPDAAGGFWPSVPRFNDETTTDEEVIRLFDVAIENTYY